MPHFPGTNKSASPRKRIRIAGGVVTAFADEMPALQLPGDYVVDRVSWIVPKNFILRSVFRLVRRIVGDDSCIAEWTRQWQCRWLVLIDGQSFGPYTARKDAIQFEKTYIWREHPAFRSPLA